MAEVMQERGSLLESGRAPRKRQFAQNQGRKKASKKPKVMPVPHGQKKVKIDKRMKKLFHKRARDYNSDDDDDEEESEAATRATKGTRSLPPPITNENNEDEVESDEPPEVEGATGRGQKTWNKNISELDNHDSEDEGEDDGVVQPGITKLNEGCRAFKMAFRNIIKKSVSDDALGPVLSAHKKLIADKLAEEDSERKIKGEAKKEKHAVAEKGHVKPESYLDSREKFLISVATKGVVKLFNAVNKAQTAQRGFDSSRNKDAKEIRKRTKEAFFSELGKPSFSTSSKAKANASTGKVEEDDEQPGWAPLRDNYMLTSARLKDWDKMPDKIVSDDNGKASEDSSSDED